MRPSIRLAILFLLAAGLFSPAGDCQGLWEIIPDDSENQAGSLGGLQGEPMGLQPQSGMDYLPQPGMGSLSQPGMGSLSQPGMDYLPQSGMGSLPPSASAPGIEFFNGPSEARPGDKVTITWKVRDACSVYLDSNPQELEGSYVYTVPMQGAPDTIRHQLIAYGKPCDHPVLMTRDLYIKIRKLEVPAAPTELNFLGWTKTPNGPTAEFEWKDNSADEHGFRIYRGTELLGSRGPDVTTIGIPLSDTCDQLLSFHVTAFNGVGESSPSNTASIDGLCPPNKGTYNAEIRKVERYDQSEQKQKYWIETLYTGVWGTGPHWFDIHVIAQSPSGENLTENVYYDVPSGEKLELNPSCSADTMVYAIPKNAAGTGRSTNVVKVRRLSSDPECNYDLAQNLDYVSTSFQFSVGPNAGDSDDYYFTVYRPGPISAKASWEGTSADLDLTLEGPGNYMLHAPGKSPRALSYLVTSKDLMNGYTWKISITNHNSGKTAAGTLTFAYPKGCCFAGTWDTNFGELKLSLGQDGQTVTGNYDHDKGRIEANIVGLKVEGNKLSGRWSESPTYSPPNDAGDLELYLSEDCETLIGYWKYGYSGDWDGEWNGQRTDGSLGLRPMGHGVR